MNNTTSTISRAGVPSFDVYAQWDFRAIFRVFTNVSALLLNSLVVYFLFMDRTKTCFKVYICNLCCVNLFYTLSYISDLITVWHKFSGAPPAVFCFLFRFLTSTKAGLVNQAHFLIGMNRVWAVMWPISYRQYNAHKSIRNSWLTCAASWGYILIWTIPGLVLGELATRNPPEMYRCSFNVLAPRSWSIPMQFLMQDLPVVMTCLVYPLVLYKTLGRVAQKRGNRVRNGPPTVLTSTSRKGAPTDMVELTTKTTENGETTRELVVLQPESSPKEDRRSWLSDTVEKLRHGQFLTLSMLCLNVAVCLLPGQVYFTLLYFDVQIPGQTTFAVISSLYALSLSFDPILLLLTIKSLRQSFKQFFVRKKD